MPMISKDDLEKIIVQGDMKMLIYHAERVGETLKSKRLTTSQIRNIFGTIRRIEMDWLDPGQVKQSEKRNSAKREFILLIPRLAYQAKKEEKRNSSVTALREELEPAMRLVIDADKEDDSYCRFRNFVDFFEAILAYHRGSGGSNN